MASSGLTVGQLAERTGVAPATLRMWESRYGFPRPQRLPSGHRRYCEEDVDDVCAVMRAKGAGLGLRVAIERTLGPGLKLEASIFAALRRLRPDLHPYALPKHALITMSRAIEDECCAHAERTVLFGSFQRERFYRSAAPRWRELARAARLAVVFADFARRRDPPDAPIELPLTSGAPLAREWSVVCQSPRFSACLAARERLGQAGIPDRERLFEVIWSAEGQVVDQAVIVAAALADAIAPDVGAAGKRSLVLSVDAVGEARIGTALTNRMVAYVAAAGRNPLSPA